MKLSYANLGMFSSMEDKLPSMENRLPSMEDKLSSMEHRLSSMEYKLRSMEHKLRSMEHRRSSMEINLKIINKMNNPLTQGQFRLRQNAIYMDFLILQHGKTKNGSCNVARNPRLAREC